MQYTQAKPGRIFVIAVEHGENIINNLQNLAEKEKISCAVFHLLGALKHAELVIGPKKPVLPPDRQKILIDNNASEFMGFGTIFLQEQKPSIHIHLSMGNKTITQTGHLLPDHEVFIISEMALTSSVKL